MLRTDWRTAGSGSSAVSFAIISLVLVVSRMIQKPRFSTGVGHKRGEFDGSEDFQQVRIILDFWNSEILRVQIRGKPNEVHVYRILCFRIRFEGIRFRRIRWHSGTVCSRSRIYSRSSPQNPATNHFNFPREYRELIDQLANLRVEQFPEQFRRPAHTIVERNARGIDQ